MYYTAIQYVRVGKRVYTPGEIITDEMTSETTERLVRKGAIWGEVETLRGNMPEPPQEAAGAPEEPEATEYQAEDDDEEQRLLMGDLVKKTERRKRR